MQRVIGMLLVVFLFYVGVIFVSADKPAGAASRCECGRSNPTPTPTGVNHLVAIARKSKHKAFCWGSLINDRYVITVGHCVAAGKRSNASQIEIWLNDGTDLVPEPPAQHLIREVEQVKLHPKYNLHNDIALIKLKNAVSISNDDQSAFSPVCLPTTHDVAFSGNGTSVDTVASSEGKWQIIKKSVPIFANDVCINGSKYKNIKETMICAGSLQGADQESSCAGDSGNPLVIDEGGRAVLVGLASWGRDCSGNPGPGVYARVSAFNQWITENTSDAVLCSRASPLP